MNATISVDSQTATSQLLIGVATDVHYLANCSWTVAMVYTQHQNLHPVCSLGEQIDLTLCRERSLMALADAESHSTASCICRYAVPGIPELLFRIRVSGMTVAVIAIGPKKGPSRYSESDCAFVAHYAENMGHLLQNERMASAVATHVADTQHSRADLQVARHLQNRLLPNCLTPIPGIDYYGECRPAEDVGGDFFDVVALRDEAVRFAVGDITGKGVPAALMMAGVQATLRGLTGASGATPLDVVHALNRRVWEISPDNVFATMFYAELDAGDGTLRYINAGHPPAFLIRAQSMAVERLDIGGTVLGLSQHSVYRQRTVSVRPGDILMASTDGLSEAADPEGRPLDEDGLLRIVRQSGSTGARDTVDSILRAVDDYTGGLSPADDRTALVIRLAAKREHGRLGHAVFATAASAA